MKDALRPEDTNTGIAKFVACWIFTVIVGITLIFRYAAKAWVYWASPYVFASERDWAVEDVLLLISYPVDVIHMTAAELGSHWGLGRHHDRLDPLEQVQSLKYAYISQPFATIAAMISRAAVACTLLTSFGVNGKQTRFTILACMLIQAVVNTISVLQVVLQCGPYPYRPANRLDYFHYMWDALPADDSVRCQSSSVQKSIGHVQEGLNAVVDFCLAAVIAADLWRATSHVFRQHPGMSVCSRLRRLRDALRCGQLWLILALGGPLVVSGAASIAKNYQFKAFKDGSDFAFDTADYVLWTKIENYTLILASCAPITRLFLRAFIDHCEDKYITHGPKSSTSRNKLATKNHDRTKPGDTGLNVNGRRTTWAPPYSQRYESRVSQASLPPQVHDGFVTVKTDIVVEVDKRRPKSRSKSWFLRDTENPKDVEARLERGV